MASVQRKAQVPVGSTEWINSEREQVSLFCEQEAEDFGFSARNEIDWLNEHMAEIFSSSQVYVMVSSPPLSTTNSYSNVTEIFKTPGKLRGKTPRTARKRNALEARAVSERISI
jgi:hypothetical protein